MRRPSAIGGDAFWLGALDDEGGHWHLDEVPHAHRPQLGPAQPGPPGNEEDVREALVAKMSLLGRSNWP